MSRIILAISFLLSIAYSSMAQNSSMDTVGITRGSVHMQGSFPYTDFVKKYKGDQELTIHIWYNPSSSSLSKKEVKAKRDDVHFFYGRNLRTASSEMDFKFGASALEVFSKKKEKELVELIDFIEFDVFAGQNFDGFTALEKLKETLE